MFCENESSPPLNQTLPLEKLLAFFLQLSQNKPITKHSKIDQNFCILFIFSYMHENMLFLSHHQTYLDITMSIICFNTSFFPCQQRHTKIPFHLDTLKKPNTISQGQTFDHKTSFLKH